MSSLLTRLSNYLCGGHYEPRTEEEGKLAKELIEYEKRYGWKEGNENIPSGVWIIAMFGHETSPRLGEVHKNRFYTTSLYEDDWSSYQLKYITKWKEVDVSND